MKDPQLEYQRQAVKNASPTELIAKLYDFAIQACYNEDQEKLDQVLGTLTKSLNFDYEISGTLYNLYDYCRRQAEKGEFEEVRELLEPVREAWMDGVVKSGEQISKKQKESKGFVV